MSKVSDYMVIKRLSSSKLGGNNQGVFLVKSNITNKSYIQKLVGKTAIDAGDAQREVRAMQQSIAHPNIVHLEVWNLDYQKLGYGSIIMQHCELGSLDMLIDQFNHHHKYLKDEGFLWKVLWDVSLALCFLYTGTDIVTTRTCANDRVAVPIQRGWNRIFHRDVKPGNVFLTWKHAGGQDKCPYPTAVLGDFGSSISDADIRVGRVRANTNSRGTPAFDPPESPMYDERSDVYAMGLILHCLARMQQVSVESPEFREYHPVPQTFRDRALLTYVLKKCLAVHPIGRPMPNELPFLVWNAYKGWRYCRQDDGQVLSSWVFSNNA
ncbi:hypothetical protein N0V83_006376 [Neocucurbitaria cava]|uniref:non-specific serine/threonine protein kinase n=1 Tax=Neocucurbitaria cava TaxID=798079 RepID=A0A9W8Y7W6_9PLEO|nr:hypothetical protein N0V83_006376 [Neocucurbitaria cava]